MKKMLETNKTLSQKNLLSFRKKLTQGALNEEMIAIGKFLQEMGSKKQAL